MKAVNAASRRGISDRLPSYWGGLRKAPKSTEKRDRYGPPKSLMEIGT
jgi:hypothetical protein